jgi:hypothetical protein
MRLLASWTLAIALAGTVGVTALTMDASAAPRSAYAAKKAECKERASHMKFGMHVIKKNRWINNCIASTH